MTVAREPANQTKQPEKLRTITTRPARWAASSLAVAKSSTHSATKPHHSAGGHETSLRESIATVCAMYVIIGSSSRSWSRYCSVAWKAKEPRPMATTSARLSRTCRSRVRLHSKIGPTQKSSEVTLFQSSATYGVYT